MLGAHPGEKGGGGVDNNFAHQACILYALYLPSELILAIQSTMKFMAAGATVPHIHASTSASGHLQESSAY